MSRLKALIFDVDGTLADTECDGHRVAFNLAFADFNLDWHWDINFYGKLLAIGGGKERIRHFIDSYAPTLPATFSHDMITQLHLRKNEHYQTILQQGDVGLRPGVMRLFNEARQGGYLLAIATTSSLSNTLALLNHHLGEQAEDWFEVIGAGDIVPNKKPAPDIYEYVLNQLQLPPESCLVFEDSEAGVTAANAAQLKTVMTLNAYTQNHDQTNATLVVNHLGEPEQEAQIIKGSVPSFSGCVDLAACEAILSED